MAAIMFTDMVGYTALGQKNESLSLALVDEQRKLIRPILARHNGREVKTIGDAFLVEFSSALDAIRCAYDIQRAIREFNFSLSEERRVHLRVGIHLGDVVESEGDISGDAVNVASRIEPLAEDGGVCLTRQVYDQVQNKFALPMVNIGNKALKNVSTPMEVYRIVMPWTVDAPAPSAQLDKRRIAVLPFTNLSSDPEEGYFADGMTEELITSLSGVRQLTVIARTSVMKYKGSQKGAFDVGRELNAGTLIEGSVRKAGNKVRITAQLIDTTTEGHLWAQNYDRQLEDVFEVQSDVAKKVADVLQVKILSPEMERIEKKPTESTVAYTLYLKGRYLWNKRGIGDLKKAAEYFEQAVKEDPSFALGYAGQADCAVLLQSNWSIDSKANLEKAKVMVAKALELDPGLAQAHTTRGFVLAEEYNLREAEEEYRKAIELKPNYATAHQWYCKVLRSELRWDEALEQIEKAVELDPLSPIINLNYGDLYCSKRDYGKALEPYKRAVELGWTGLGGGVGWSGGHGGLIGAYGMMKMYDEMRREAATLVDCFQDSFPLLRTGVDAWIAHLEDDRQTVRKLLPEIETHIQETMWTAYSIACAHFYLGESDKGFEWLERSYSWKEDSLLDIKWDLDLDGVRSDPRYLDLLKKLELD